MEDLNQYRLKQALRKADMTKVESLRSKYLYKILLILLKYIPIVTALFYVLNTVTALCEIDIPAFSNFAGMSLFTWILIYIADWVFQFCIYHRMFLYYILATDLINIADYYIGIPIDNYGLMAIHGAITGISLFLILYFYVKSNKRAAIKDSR